MKPVNKREYERREPKHPKAKERPRRCETCGVEFDPEELLQDHDEQGRSTGWYCGGCI